RACFDSSRPARRHRGPRTSVRQPAPRFRRPWPRRVRGGERDISRVYFLFALEKNGRARTGEGEAARALGQAAFRRGGRKFASMPPGQGVTVSPATIQVPESLRKRSSYIAGGASGLIRR